MPTKFVLPPNAEMPKPGRERRARGVSFNEEGALGLKHSGGFIREEYLREIQGPKGMKIIREMMDNDPIVGGFLFAVEQAIRQVDWKVIPAIAKPPDPKPQAMLDPLTGLPYKEPSAPIPPPDPNAPPPDPKAVKKFEEMAAPSPESNGWQEARKYANFVDSCRLDMCMTWSDVMTEALSFLPFGWSLLEATYKVRRGYNADLEVNSKFEDGLVGWKKMAPRAQESLRRWVYSPTDPDRLTHMQQFTLEKGTVDIPLARCLHFRTKSFKDNPEGRSILRNCYRPWYLKKRIEEVEGIGIERDLAGLPVLTAAEGADLWNEADPQSVVARKAAERIVRNIRIDEQMGVLLPFGWTLELLATGGKRSLNTTDIINRYSQHMAMTVLADFMMLGHTNRLGSFALARSKTTMFAMTLVGYLNVIRDTFNTFELPRLWRLNGFPMELMPKLDYTPVDAPALKDLASYVTAISGAGVDFSVPELQRYMLQLAGIPGDITDLAGMGGTGDGNLDGIPDDAEAAANDPNADEEDDEEQQPVGRSGGVRPASQRLGRRPGVPNTGRSAGRSAGQKKPLRRPAA